MGYEKLDLRAAVATAKRNQQAKLTYTNELGHSLSSLLLPIAAGQVMISCMATFIEPTPRETSCWRSVILFGANVACYKFALGKSLLSFAAQGKGLVTLEEVAVPYTAHIADHLKKCDKQGTSQSSSYLDECRKFAQGTISQTAIVDASVKLGFGDVLDAFHTVRQERIPMQFFEIEKKNGKIKLHLTEQLNSLAQDNAQLGNLSSEVESRWRLVETAWDLGISRALLIDYDPTSNNLILNDQGARVDVTSCRSALVGYQKGRCFYCFESIGVRSNSTDTCDVDHLIPHVIQARGMRGDLDGVWNLVLSCSDCNRGEGGKFDRIPDPKYLERLHIRNEFLIASHHPLRETLIRQSGASEEDRRAFLIDAYKMAESFLSTKWTAPNEGEPWF